jgi:hypothetical protein
MEQVPSTACPLEFHTAAEDPVSICETLEGGYTARSVGNAVFTEPDTMEEARQAVRGVVTSSI